MRKTQRRARERQDCEYADLSGDEYSGLLAWSWPLCASPEGLDCIRHHIRREPTASKALDHVLGSNNDLSHEYYMLALVYATVVGARLSRASYEKRLMANTGKTLKSAREFPARIERLAAEIEKMNANPFFRSIHVDSLSLALTRHARFLAERIKFFNATPSLGTQPGLLLSFAVRDWTGSFHDEQVADLLTAAAVALGRGGVYDAQKLRQWRKDYRKASIKGLAGG